MCVRCGTRTQSDAILCWKDVLSIWGTVEEVHHLCRALLQECTMDRVHRHYSAPHQRWYPVYIQTVFSVRQDLHMYMYTFKHCSINMFVVIHLLHENKAKNKPCNIWFTHSLWSLLLHQNTLIGQFVLTKVLAQMMQLSQCDWLKTRICFECSNLWGLCVEILN